MKYAGEHIMGGYVSSAGSGYLVKNKEKYVSVCKNATNYSNKNVSVLPSQSPFSIQTFFTVPTETWSKSAWKNEAVSHLNK